MYTINLKDLSNGICGIYKIDFPNGKVYIGQSNNIKRRMYEHNQPNREDIICDKAIHKYYGKVNTITILEECQIENLNEREEYWIKFYRSNEKEFGYNLTKGGNNRASEPTVFTEEEVLDIRKRRFMGERKTEVYQNYNDKSFSTFEHIWLGTTWPHVGKEYIIPTNSISRQEYSSKANKGENNNKAKLNEIEVLKIRERYKNGEDITNIWHDYQYVSRETIKRVCLKQTWKHLE